MKITKILPKPLAIYYQEYDLNRTDGELEYYKAMIRVLEEKSHEGHEELQRLREKRKWDVRFVNSHIRIHLVMSYG